ncbi:FCS-Like Zinc finger 14-like [Zingiber officinale]|nr:FCS-Like Zinc finger 14-like [Zingiber officinale]
MGTMGKEQSQTNRKAMSLKQSAETQIPPPFPFLLLLLPNPHSPFVGRSIEMVHPPKPIVRRWWDRDRGRVGLGIAVALDHDDAGPSPRKLHAAAPMMICSPRVRCGSSAPTGRAGFTVGFCGGARARVGDSPVAVAEESSAADFLSDCYVCRKKLHGEDIFMYREKAFCSMECRYKKMVADEYQEQHVSKARKRSTEIASSPCSGGQLFFTGIVVT